LSIVLPLRLWSHLCCKISVSVGRHFSSEFVWAIPQQTSAMNVKFNHHNFRKVRGWNSLVWMILDCDSWRCILF